MKRPDWSLRRDPFGRLILADADGTEHHGVMPVRAFPIGAPHDGIALVGADGHELAWIDRLFALPDDLRAMLEEELSARDFTPEILRILSVSRFATPSTWDVETDRGRTQLLLRGEEFIRRLPGGGLMIADEHGIHFLVRDLQALDRGSRALLDRFL